MDFGVARVRGAEHMTMDGHIVGTPAYMAPEQVLAQEVDGRADLYSVGVVFYRLLAGALPFVADTPVGMLQQQIAESPTLLSQHRDDLPEWCEAIVQRALAKSPADRFQTAGEFRKALGFAPRAWSPRRIPPTALRLRTIQRPRCAGTHVDTRHVAHRGRVAGDGLCSTDSTSSSRTTPANERSFTRSGANRCGIDSA